MVAKSARTTGFAGLLRLLATVIVEPASLRLGVTSEAGQLRWVAITAGRSGIPQPLVQGSGVHIPLWLRCIVPLVAQADMGLVPVQVVAEAIGNEDPDAWIDRNEERCRPAGFSAGQIAADYHVDGSEITVMSAAHAARDARLAALERTVTVASLLPPLSGFAAAYKAAFDGPWICWKLCPQGSVAGLIDRGKVRDVFHFWADIEAFRAAPAAVFAEIAPLFRSIGAGSSPLRLMCVTDDGTDASVVLPETDDIRFISRPDLPNVAPVYHEAFGIALDNGATAQLLPFQKQQKALRARGVWHTTLSAIRCVALGLAVLVFVGGSSIGIGRALKYADRAVMHDIDKKYAAMHAAEIRRDSLMRRFDGFAAMIGGESRVTALLSALQTVFPEGVAVEELAIVERDASSWQLVVRAVTGSSSLMQPVIGNLQAVRGVSDARMVYSEQIAGKKPIEGIRFKIEAVWR
jgi:hypothetical protein